MTIDGHSHPATYIIMDDAQLFVDKRIHKNDARERAEMKEGINHQLLLLDKSFPNP
jgi:hypothetical protein